MLVISIRETHKCGSEALVSLHSEGRLFFEGRLASCGSPIPHSIIEIPPHVYQYLQIKLRVSTISLRKSVLIFQKYLPIQDGKQPVSTSGSL